MYLSDIFTIGANLAHGLGHGPIGALVSAWPALALAGSFELLMTLITPIGTLNDLIEDPFGGKLGLIYPGPRMDADGRIPLALLAGEKVNDVSEVTLANGPPQATNYLVDTSGALGQVVAESDGAGHPSAFYLRGDDLLAVIRPSGTRFYHADGLGSIRSLTDESGAETDHYATTAFGEPLTHTGSDPNPYLFAGEAVAMMARE